jgi:chromate reductase
MTETVRVLGISGSLRRASWNTIALRAAQSLAPEGMTIEIASIREIPFYDGDVEASTGIPAEAAAFREKIRAADALLIASPEYNASIPGVLKNALDWASRPPHQPLDGKPIAIFGVSPGATGTIRGQQHLRQTLANVNGLVLVQPVVAIGNAAQRFDAEGNLTDDATRNFVATMLVNLADWTRRLKP